MNTYGITNELVMLLVSGSGNAQTRENKIKVIKSLIVSCEDCNSLGSILAASGSQAGRILDYIESNP